MSTFREALRELPDAIFADLLGSDDAYLLVVDLPGATAETVDASVENGRLSIEAGREPDVPADFQVVSEGRESTLSVDVPLPVEVTGEGAEATMDRGVLEVRLPKASAESGTTIPVR
ncbi:molecular chaperone Hsp20 [Halobacteriales archaeon QH_2_65_14]|nr:MAG: molecular chaperone Hsp20 [Halobacteriales archaeon QH_2_65_14]